MSVQDARIDGGRAFDWGRTSVDYARFRDIYPPLFYQKILDRGLCVAGQRVLDIGTGTGRCSQKSRRSSSRSRISRQLVSGK